MVDTTNTVKFFKEPVDTKPSTDTDEILNQYINLLDRIYKEDDEYREIINNVRKGVINDRTSK